jgi:hypothetical protein
LESEAAELADRCDKLTVQLGEKCEEVRGLSEDLNLAREKLNNELSHSEKSFRSNAELQEKYNILALQFD